MDGKSGVDEYLAKCGELVISMDAYGFKPEHAVPIDPDGELLGGAHRVACALALGLAEIPVTRHSHHASAPAWGRAWFVDNGMGAEDLERLCADYAALAASGSGS